MGRIWFVLLGLMGAVLACGWNTNTTPTPDLPTRMYTRLDEAVASYAQALDLWERLVAGDTVVSCAEQLTVPAPWLLTETETIEYPASVTMSNHLNNGIALLSQVAGWWQTECSQPRQQIPIEALRDIQTILNQAENELRVAENSWRDWQS